jgi:hypothetical protein
MQFYSTFLLLLLATLSGCKPSRPGPSQEQLLKSAESYERNIVDNVLEVVETKERDTKGLGKICEAIRINVLDYLKAQSDILKSPTPLDLKKSYQELSEQPTELTLKAFWDQLIVVKPILYKLQTDVLFDAKEVLAISEEYEPGKIARACPLLDAFLRLSFDEPVDYALFIIDLFELAPIEYIHNLVTLFGGVSE